ncbi:MAG TPA: hypothetical protein VMU19_00895 [Bryobacteraceae bacterium]|nr:hypothetical protein [Bryobacteraceae bacterium]
MWRSGGVKPAALPEQGPPPPRIRGIYRALLVIVVFAATVVFVFPLAFDPGVEAPTDLEFGNPSSVVIEVSNQNVTPLLDLQYTCELSSLTLANGSTVTNARELVRGTIRRIPGRRAFEVRCEAAYILTAPIKSAEYKLTVGYRAYPWPRRRSSSWRIAAKVNDKGDVTGWKVT